MRNIVLISVLIIALLVGFGTVIFYNIQDYEYSLELKESISISEVYVALTPEYQLRNAFGNILNNSPEIQPTIQDISMILGKMSFENKGSISRVIEIPRFVACVDLSLTQSYNSVGRILTSIGRPSTYAIWPIYSTNEPIFNVNSNLPHVYPGPITSEIYPQYNNAQNNNQPSIEIKRGDKTNYYIYLKNAYLNIDGNDSTALKNTKIEIYDLPIKDYNPLSEGVNFQNLIYNPTCDVLSKEFEPVKTIEII
ncbi:hypothetical protein J4462_04990 [Candidatus Pacearchaeota archaeon]|nr:hypothetical protein [Candidatus Pacearchaeota archaeon]